MTPVTAPPAPSPDAAVTGDGSRGTARGPAGPTVTPRPSGQVKGIAPRRDRADPCTMVIFGAMGDLTKRKLMPAVYSLMLEGLVDPEFAVLGVGREACESDEVFREKMRDAIQQSDEVHGFDAGLWHSLCERLHYVCAELTDPDAYGPINQRLQEIEANRAPADRNRLFYLAVPPSIFEPIVRNLSTSGLAPRTGDPTARPWVRVVVEKPFGRNLQTATELNHLVLSLFDEHQVFRIDHYLGKETVQNVLVLRFANSIFEPLWNRQWIQNVQITAAEDVGVGTRGKYYEEAGVVRDMFQNHLLQLLALTAMEPPYTMSAGAVRDEKVKVLKSVRWMNPDVIGRTAVRAQYRAGPINGKLVPGYIEEPDVDPTSTTPTYAAVRLYIDNWRWNGVPFYLRSGKRMKKRVSEIAVTFRSPPHLMFGHQTREVLRPNTLVMRVQPDEGVNLNFEVKVPGAAVALTSEIEVAPVDMDFTYDEVFGETSAPAYETLLLDVMIGEATLFTRSDEVEAAWRVIDPLIDYWDRHPPEQMPTYAAGTWGPREADELITSDRVRWREP
ncbi:MAG TPA: glucose-6-phosphate dehydrogenase [Gemmatimonadaceae bacterium]|nr:glucose-6-phosphate dehydrogenase [Gemmatimonadaceae bacterium]